jgi:hypothetical protein
MKFRLITGTIQNIVLLLLPCAIAAFFTADCITFINTGFYNYQNDFSIVVKTLYSGLLVLYALCNGGQRHDGRDYALLLPGLCCAFLADVCFGPLSLFSIGMVLFIPVLILYTIRHGRGTIRGFTAALHNGKTMRGHTPKILIFMEVISFLFIYGLNLLILFVIVKPFFYTHTLFLAALIYSFFLCTAVWRAFALLWTDNPYNTARCIMIIIGFGILFPAGDLLLLLHILFLQSGTKILRLIACLCGMGVWLFYAPAQALIMMSGFKQIWFTKIRETTHSPHS